MYDMNHGSIQHTIRLSALFYFSLYCSTSVDGYLIGRLLRLQNPSDGGGEEEKTPYYPATSSSSGQETGDLGSLITSSYPSKKSQYMGYKSLKKFNSNGSRNCFFTPVQCMIEHDMSKYKKLVDSNIRIGGVARK
uniref:Uncharacterized protein n=1 Tax=Ditylenchus dipsaci TaxID=166011 RepID=A0A915CN99_9BILA